MPANSHASIDPPGVALHRIDREHGVIDRQHDVERPPIRRSSVDVPSIDVQRAETESQVRVSETPPTDATVAGSIAPDLLRLHCTDLVERLQSWAADLDQREAQLNARASAQDHRERQFRLQRQDVAAELDEQQRSAERLHRELESLRRELEAKARRLAFVEPSL